MLHRLPCNRDVLGVHEYLSLHELGHRLLLRLVNARAAHSIFLVLSHGVGELAVVRVVDAVLARLHLLFEAL